MVIVPAREVEFLDTWYVSGLCGTGSTDYRIPGVFVPEERVVGWQLRRPLELPSAAFPNFTLLAMGIGAVALGVARASIDELLALAATKKPTHSSKTLAERGDVQAAVARAEAELRAARAFYYEAASAGWDAALASGRVALPLRRDIRVATTHATHSAVRVAQAMYECGGGTALYRRSPLQTPAARRARDDPARDGRAGDLGDGGPRVPRHRERHASVVKPRAARAPDLAIAALLQSPCDGDLSRHRTRFAANAFATEAAPRSARLERGAPRLREPRRLRIHAGASARRGCTAHAQPSTPPS